jgi:hypothetical protein
MLVPEITIHLSRRSVNRKLLWCSIFQKEKTAPTAKRQKSRFGTQIRAETGFFDDIRN